MADHELYESVRLTADVVAIAYQQASAHVLLIRRGWSPYAGCWALPGGHVDPGETVQAAAQRELAEETGLQFAGHFQPIRAYAEPGRDPRGRYVTFAHLIVLDTLPAVTGADDATDARWVPLDTIRDQPSCLAFDHGDIIRDAIALYLGTVNTDGHCSA